MRGFRAFTLIETVLSLALLVSLAGVMFATFRGVSARRDRLQLQGAQVEGAALLLERIEQALYCGVAGDAKHGSGVVGSGDSLVVLSRGVAPGEPPTRVGLYDLQRTSISFDAGRREVSLSRAAAEGGGGLAEVVARGVQRLEFSFYDGASWTEDFDSGSAGLPVAVQVSVWFGAETPTVPGDEPRVEPRADDNEWRDSAAEIGEETWPAEEEVVDEAGGRATPGPADLSRIITVPDGPVSPWKGGA